MTKKKCNEFTNIFDAQIQILEVNIFKAGCEKCISFTIIMCIFL